MWDKNKFVDMLKFGDMASFLMGSEFLINEEAKRNKLHIIRC